MTYVKQNLHEVNSEQNILNKILFVHYLFVTFVLLFCILYFRNVIIIILYYIIYIYILNMHYRK